MLRYFPDRLGRTLSSKRMISSATSVNPLKKFMTVQPDVQRALDAGLPVVALESTIVAHGMPFPENLELAKDVENILRSKVNTGGTIFAHSVQSSF